MTLTSVKMQSVIIGKNYFDEWYMPILRFGKGKNRVFKMPIFIKGSHKKKISSCYKKLLEFKGQDIENIRAKHDDIVIEFNEYNSKSLT